MNTDRTFDPAQQGTTCFFYDKTRFSYDTVFCHDGRLYQT